MARCPSFPPRQKPSGKAARALARGDIVAFPTETVYGLGANALDARAVAKVFAAKERPRFNPLIVHVPGLAAAETYAVVNDMARMLAEAFWPGPLSLVLNKRPACGIADLVSAGLDTIALRAPAHPVAQALLAEVKLPIAAPSANRSGRISPTTAAHVEAELGERPAMILDGGPCPLGIESTVVSVVGREPACSGQARCPARRSSSCWESRLPWPKRIIGGLRRGSLRPITRPIRSSGSAPRASAPTRLCSPSAATCLRGARVTINLSASGNLEEAAAKLFAALRELDQAGAQAIAVMPIPAQGLGEAINDRLQRAANRG